MRNVTAQNDNRGNVLQEGSHRYYILILDVRTDKLDVVVTTQAHVPVEMLAIRDNLRKAHPFSLVMFRPYNAESKIALQRLLSAIKTTGSLPSL